MNPDQAWQSVLAQLQLDMAKASFDTWVRDTYPLSYEAGILTIAVPNAYARDWLESRLASTVNRLLIGVMDSNATVNFVVAHADEAASTELDAPAPMAEQPVAARPHHSSLNPRYTFENFVVGSANRLAHAACQAVAEKPARAYNPLFVYGGVGL